MAHLRWLEGEAKGRLEVSERRGLLLHFEEEVYYCTSKKRFVIALLLNGAPALVRG
jgi:hypothetical protein